MNLFVSTYVHMAGKKRTILGSKAPPKPHQIWSSHQKCTRNLPHGGEVQTGKAQEAYFSPWHILGPFACFWQPGAEPTFWTVLAPLSMTEM